MMNLKLILRVGIIDSAAFAEFVVMLTTIQTKDIDINDSIKSFTK